MRSVKKLATAFIVVAALGSLAACGGSGSTSSASNDKNSTSNSSSPSMDPAANLVGPGCQAYANKVPNGAGSVAGMAQDPVAVAASNNPLLTTLVAAVSGNLNPKVNLVDTLNGDQFTVFAPVDDAFGKLPKSTVASLAKPANADTLSKILTYHVIPGQIAPSDLPGTQTTVQGGMLKVTGSGDNLKVNGVPVICGGVQTANATVYLIGSVLMPKM